MSISDSVYYIVFGNPLSQQVLTSVAEMLNSAGIKPKSVAQQTTQVIQQASSHGQQLSLWQSAGASNNFVRLAGISGAMAVMMGAYGKHMLAAIQDPKEQHDAKTVFEIAHRYHCLNSIVLLAMPLTHRPLLSGTLMAAGTVLFSGTNYYIALTGDRTLKQVTAIGGFCLIAAWLSMVF